MRSIEAEQSVLGSLLLDNPAIYRVGHLQADHFFAADHRIIFSTITSLISLKESADVITVFEALGESAKNTGGMQYLNALAQNTPSSANIRHYADIVIDHALRRKLISDTAELAEAMASTTIPTAILLEKAQVAISSFSDSHTKNEPVAISEALILHSESLDKKFNGEMPRIKTGFQNIDEMLNGGLDRGDLIIIGARPSMGKTAFALNLTNNISHTHKALFLSQEMTIPQLVDRQISSIARIPLGKLITGNLNEEDWKKYTRAISIINKFNLRIDEQGGLSIFEVKSKARKVKRSMGLDVLLVDYLQLMRGDGKNRNDQIETISRELKALAKELNVAVIALSQLNREVERRTGNRPTMADLRDSGAIEQDADVIVFIHRDEVINPDTHLKGLADFIFSKNRQGKTGDLLMRYYGDFTTFESTNELRPFLPQQTRKSRGLAEHL